MKTSTYLALALLVTACGEGHDGGGSQPKSEGGSVNQCTYVASAYRAALDDMLASEPECQADTDCVRFADSFACPGIADLSGCGIAMHRETAESFDKAALMEEICGPLRPGETQCSVQASCIATGEPVCSAGQCELPWL